MPKLSEVSQTVRSKNAGPFWITIDIFFGSHASWLRYSNCVALSKAAIGELFDVDPAQVKRFSLEPLHVLKFSYPRAVPQGGLNERDMHGGQQYARLLNLELGV